MYISKVQLDPRKRETVRALQNRELLHSAIEQTIEGERPHILWRLEPDMSILALSREIPYWGEVYSQFGNGVTKPVCKPYDDYLETITNGCVMKFKLIVNPVINKADGSKNGKDVPLNLKRTKKYPFSAGDWVKKKLEERGVIVDDIQATSHETVYFVKDKQRIPIFTVTYSGIFRVTDANLLKEAMRTGIGGKRSYGCGMLTAIKIKGLPS